MAGRRRAAAAEAADADGAGAVILCAGASQRELVDRGVRELRLDARDSSDPAPEALAGAARALVALAVNGSPRDVALSVLGVPPAHTVIPWEDATIAGFALTRQIDEPSRRRLAARVAALWPPGPYALASAAATVVEAMAGRSRRHRELLRRARHVPPARATGPSALPVRLSGVGHGRTVWCRR